MKKKSLALLLSGLIICSVCACGKKEEPVAEVETPVVEEATEEEKPTEPEKVEEPEATEEATEAVEEEPEKDCSYAPLYLDEIEKLHSSGQADSFALINVDGDDIPELVAVNSVGNIDSNDSVFLYTVYDNRVCSLYSGLVGMYGCSLNYSENNNIIFETGGSVGFSMFMKEITQGELTELLNVEIIPDITGEGNSKYYLDNNEIKVEDLDKALLQELVQYNPFTKIDYDGLHTVVFEDEGDYLGKETNVTSYMTYEEISKELRELLPKGENEEKKLRSESNGENDDVAAWKTAYNNCLNDIINGNEYLEYAGDAFTYNDAGGALFALDDITEDDIPELLVAPKISGDRLVWKIYSSTGEGYENIGTMSFYDSENKKVYLDASMSFEEYKIFNVENNRIELEGSYGEGDVEGWTTPWYKCDAQDNYVNISEDEMNAFRSGFNAGLEKYGIKGIDLTKENIDKELG